MTSGFVLSAMTSGFSLVGGQLFTSGFRVSIAGLDAPEAFQVGGSIDVPAVMPFQLAPRNYLISLFDESKQNCSSCLDHSDVLGQLPVYLCFKDASRGENVHIRQRWASECTEAGEWELLVERLDASVKVTLTASRSGHSSECERLVWESTAEWLPFGHNRLESTDPRMSSLVLMVAGS